MRLFKLSIAGLVAAAWLCAVAPSYGAAAARSDGYQRLLREASVALLRDGNVRFVERHAHYPNQDSERRVNVAVDGQEPFATIITCSDSRLPPELIFDRGLGDLFVVRVAGNVAGESELASLEYGVGHLSTPLLVVLGHSGCGAVAAVASGAELHGHLHQLAKKIQPAVAKVRAQEVAADDFLAQAVEGNVWQTVSEILRNSEVIRTALTNRTVQVVGAVYDITSGKVTWLGPHPDQDSFTTKQEHSSADSHGKASALHSAEKPEPPHYETERRPIPSLYLLPPQE